MKLIIQIPCLNEAETLAVTIADLPREIVGIDEIEYLVIDDGSTDDTVKVARECGVHHVISLGSNMGLARAFMTGLEKCLTLGADVIVNTDADNQYVGEDIKCLVEPILAGEAQIVVGARPIREIEGFSPLKKALQRLGSWVVRRASGTDIPDAPSGFRAYHKNAASQLYVLNTYSYTLETIIQAGRKRIPMTSVPIRVNGELRPSRLFKSIPEYIGRSAKTILRVSMIYRPLATFTTLAVWIALPGIIGIGRFVSFYLRGDGGGHIQSLVLSGALVAIACVVMVAGILSDLIAANRDLLQDIRARQLRQAIPDQDSKDVSAALATKLRKQARGRS